MCFWPEIEIGARLVDVMPDEAGGELFMWAVIDEKEYRGIIYEDMYYTQLREDAAGLTVTKITEIPQIEAKLSKQPQAVRFIKDCMADDEFLWDTYRKGYRLFVHHANDGGEYIVMARKCVWGEPRSYNGANGNELLRADSDSGGNG